MSKNASWSYTATATYWSRTGSNENGVSNYDAPVTFKCSFVEGGESAQGDDGVEFTPRLTLYTEEGNIKRGDYIAMGDQTAIIEPAQSIGSVVRSKRIYDETLFNDIPDYRYQTAGGS